MKTALGLFACALGVLCQASLADDVPQKLEAKLDADIEDFVKKYKDTKFTELFIRIEWNKCTAKGFAALRDLNVEVISLHGDSTNRFEQRDGRFIFKAINAPDSFAESISGIKSLKRIDVWYGSLSERQKEIIKKSLPNCEFRENMNKI